MKLKLSPLRWSKGWITMIRQRSRGHLISFLRKTFKALDLSLKSWRYLIVPFYSPSISTLDRLHRETDELPFQLTAAQRNRDEFTGTLSSSPQRERSTVTGARGGTPKKNGTMETPIIRIISSVVSFTLRHDKTRLNMASPFAVSRDISKRESRINVEAYQSVPSSFLFEFVDLRDRLALFSNANIQIDGGLSTFPRGSIIER